MPILPPALDDRSFPDLVDELLARIAAHTPEWRDPRPGDPGVTILELFAWLADTLLYRANLVPERQHIAFLRLLGIPLRAAVAARGLVAVALDERNFTESVTLAARNTIKGPVTFETIGELTVLPITGAVFAKRLLEGNEASTLASVIAGLRQVYSLTRQPRPYVVTPLFAGGLFDPAGFDMAHRTVDQTLWFALLALSPETVPGTQQTLGRGPNGESQLLNIGFVPSLEVPALFEEVGTRGRIPFTVEISTGREVRREPEYVPLTVLSDTTLGLRRRGVIRVALPSARDIGAPPNNVRQALDAGVGDRPPRIDAPELAGRLVTWVRLRPLSELDTFSVSWAGINTVEIDQRLTLANRVIATSDGSPSQQVALPAASVEPETLLIDVEESDRGYVRWRAVDDLALATRDDAVFQLDAEAGTLRFGDGLHGRIPEAERRIRVALMRAGGGRNGNLPTGSLAQFAAPRDLNGVPIRPKLKVQQPLPTTGGEEAESYAQAEERIPSQLRHRDRAVTAQDYKSLAAETPGVLLGRVEVLPRFKPQQRRPDVPGVVSVMVLPRGATTDAPYPRPDRPTLEAVHQYLDTRRPLATELYVIGCEYVPLAASVAVSIRDGFDRDTVLNSVREALKLFFWSLPPGGPDLTGWPLGRAVRDRELEVAVARVAGIDGVGGINLFDRHEGEWAVLPRPVPSAPVERVLEAWQLPELLRVVVEEGTTQPANEITPSPGRAAGRDGIAVPVVPDVCR